MKFVTTIFLSLACLISIAQTRYETRKIAKWTLEYFPSSYLVKPHHVRTVNKFGRLAYYQEVNAYGQPNGLTIEMQDNLIYPYTANYFCKGVMVYSASYFSNSNKAESIANNNLKNETDGPQITRTLKENRSVSENKTLYKNGKDIRERDRKRPQIPYNSEGLLSGSFTIENNPFGYPDFYMIYKIKATDGYLEYFEARQKDSSYVSYEINGYCVKCTRSEPSGKYSQFGRLVKRIKIASEDVPADNDSRQINWDQWDIRNDMTWLEQDLGPTKIDDSDKQYMVFNNNLLEGGFSSDVFCNAKIEGSARYGVIQEMLISYIDGSYKRVKKTGNKYVIQKLDRNRNISKVLEFEITHPVLLVKDKSKQSNNIDESYEVGIGFNLWDPIFKMAGHSEEIKAL